MDKLAEELNHKLRHWRPDIADEVRQRVTDLIHLADQDSLDILRSRHVEQEVLDLLDDSETR